ncbi:MAG: Hpt domain-containing protein, partial [Proteobacteria bacterium]|nr:Hpt domain-containing protein [Pseudomonadota bacterium]
QLPAEMYTTYVLRREDDLNDRTKAVEKSDVPMFRKVGHQLKGNASSFGFDELLTISARMHNIDETNIAVDGPSIIEDLKNWITTKKQTYGIKP